MARVGRRCEIYFCTRGRSVAESSAAHPAGSVTRAVAVIKPGIEMRTSYKPRFNSKRCI